MHLGNGTEDIFRDDGRVLLCSLYQYPLYPDSTRRSVPGRIVNCPLPAGSGSDAFRAAVTERWLPALEAFAPQMIFVSAGFDAHAADPLAELRLATDDYAWVTDAACAVADRHASGRVVSTLEGGYDLPALAYERRGARRAADGGRRGRRPLERGETVNPDLEVAGLALAQRHLGDVLAPLERAAATDSADPMHWKRVVEIARQIGDDDLALVAARRLLESGPRDPSRRAVVADLLSQTGAVRDALGISRKLLDENPKHPLLPLAIGIQLGRLGRQEDALRSLRLAVRRSPQLALAWENLANLWTFRPGDPDLAELERLAPISGDGPEAAGFAYALAKAYDDIGDVDRAFEWFARSQRPGARQPPAADGFDLQGGPGRLRRVPA